jgi:intraflagellar transport protein 122
MLCYANEEMVTIVSGLLSTTVFKDSSRSHALDLYEQFISGAVIGFSCQRIYSVTQSGVSFLDIPQGASMLKAINIGDYEAAYKVACLGATDTEWRLLGMRALLGNNIRVAKNAMAHIKDVKYLSLLENIRFQEHINGSSSAQSNGAAPMAAPTPPLSTSGETSKRGRAIKTTAVDMSKDVTTTTTPTKKGLDGMWHAEVLAYEGLHMDAAKMLARQGRVDDAVRVMLDLKRWEDAKMFASGSSTIDTGELTTKHANWLLETNDWRGSAGLFMSLREYKQAANIVIRASTTATSTWASVLIDVVRSTPKDDKEVLYMCGDAFTAKNEDAYAKETFQRVGDLSKLMALYSKRQMWIELAKLAGTFIILF